MFEKISRRIFGRIHKYIINRWIRTFTRSTFLSTVAYYIKKAEY